MAEQEAQEYVISNAYPAIAKATGAHKFFEAHGNKLFVWRLFFEGREGYCMTNRKEDNPPQKGDTVYGVIGEDQFGNATFKSESRPMGMLPARKPDSTPTSGELEAKVDYLITLVEGLAEHAGIKDVVLEDIDDGPIDLSEIPF
jgi:hypothetical protein